MKKLAIALVVAGTAMVTTQAQAAIALNGSCGSAISVTGSSTVDSCIGWYRGNVLNSNSNDTINAALAELGYAGPAILYKDVPLANIISSLDGNQTVDFPGKLNGTIFMGLHFGGSAPGDAGNNTAFFKLSATDLDTIHVNYETGSSNAVMLVSVPSTVTEPKDVAAVPEPATWALMLLGFAGIGLAMRRRKQHMAVKYNFT
jgi:hypothetical protein